MRVLNGLFAGAGLLLVVTGQASAGFTNQIVTPTYHYPALGTVVPFGSAAWLPPNFAIGSGIEASVATNGSTGSPDGSTITSVDFGDSTLTMISFTALSSPSWNAATFNGPVFTAATPYGIATAHVDPATTLSGFDDSRISFTSNDIAINWSGLSYASGTVVQIDFTFSPIPEPNSIALLGLALSGLAAARCRWRAS